MKIKTSELIGPALDWAVSQYTGHEWTDGDLDAGEYGPGFRPSTDWAHGGPIIERGFIECTVMPCGHSSPTSEPWLATLATVDEDATEASGPTPLIAAMRCYVAAKHGDEIEIPEELR